MFQDIFLFISIPATVTILNVLFEKNYWDMAGISWAVIGLLKLYDINPLIGILAIACGVAQCVYGHQVEKEKKRLLATMEKPQKSKITFADQLKSSLNSLKDHNKP